LPYFPVSWKETKLIKIQKLERAQISPKPISDLPPVQNRKLIDGTQSENTSCHPDEGDDTFLQNIDHYKSDRA
jgi:hypothetical protein